MPHFRKHYTREEARRLLPEVRAWLEELLKLRDAIGRQDEKLKAALGLGDDLGGPLVDAHAKSLAAFRQALLQFESREIQIKDLDRGLIDFPAFIQGREVFLCWEKGEEDIEFWHDLEAGYAGRERL
jgi:hypothetical protein